MHYLFVLLLLFFFITPANAAGNTEDKSGNAGYQNEHQKNQKNEMGEYFSNEKPADTSKSDEAQAEQKHGGGTPATKKDNLGLKQTNPNADGSVSPESDPNSRRITQNHSNLHYFGKGIIVTFSRQQKKIRLDNTQLMTLDDEFTITSYKDQQGDFLRRGTLVSLFGVMRNGKRVVTTIDYYPSQGFLNNKTPH